MQGQRGKPPHGQLDRFGGRPLTALLARCWLSVKQEEKQSGEHVEMKHREISAQFHRSGSLAVCAAVCMSVVPSPSFIPIPCSARHLLLVTRQLPSASQTQANDTPRLGDKVNFLILAVLCEPQRKIQENQPVVCRWRITPLWSDASAKPRSISLGNGH